MIRTTICLLLVGISALPDRAFAECDAQQIKAASSEQPPCKRMETVTILGAARSTRDIAGGASQITSEALQVFSATDVSRALKSVPGTSVQAEDGFGLRPNISIRGTPSERSSRITLLEDNVLIAPAPYAAPAAYYFPTFGRIHSVEVLKGPAAVSQGPYTIGGALNLISTPIPDARRGQAILEGGSSHKQRLHAWYGDQDQTRGWVVETHQWRSDGYQKIDRSDAPTGLDKSDFMAKLGFASDPLSEWFQQLDIKLQTSKEVSGQSYLGLSDQDFQQQPLRRYGVSELDNMHNSHEQVTVNWRLELSGKSNLFFTLYHNETERAWYKTEGVDFDGSDSPDSFQRTGWSSVIDAINLQTGLNGLDHHALQAILDGSDTAAGSIQLRNNARSYFARGIQAGLEHAFTHSDVQHGLKFGVRWHRDQEDRLQRNDSYQQLNGKLILNERGGNGNAGNRIQDADAWSFFVQDRIEFDRWVLTPGIRYENIQQRRTEFGADTANPGARDSKDIRAKRSNQDAFWIPGIGTLYAANDRWSLLAGVHRGFSAPGDKQGVDAELSVNYEAGLRFHSGTLSWEAIAFFQDYKNLQGICTASSGTGCEIGDGFNGKAVSVPGLEFQLSQDLSGRPSFSVPVQVSYTWMNARFETHIAGSEFFGDVAAGDPVPYIPDHQFFISVGLEKGAWSGYLSTSWAASVCTRASCGAFEKTESSAVMDLAVHKHVNEQFELYLLVDNLTRQRDIASRQPYGARPGKDRSWTVGARFTF